MTSPTQFPIDTAVDSDQLGDVDYNFMPVPFYGFRCWQCGSARAGMIQEAI